ncbi:MAG: methyltransferase domain-containing protein [Synechococcaceae cyanobacterium ELA445]
MPNTSTPHQLNIGELRQAYERGENIVNILRDKNKDLSTSDIIEIAYDLQAGSYTQIAEENPELQRRYAAEIYSLCQEHIRAGDSILDCGAGELTTLSALSHHLPSEVRLFAFDLSISRIQAGRRFVSRMMRDDCAKQLTLFAADMANIPLATDSIDVVMTIHALEPNHGRESELLAELLRVTRRKLILFEPSWEMGSDAVRARMRDHGYVRNLPSHVAASSAHLVSVRALPHPLNQLNPTHCYIIDPNKHKLAAETDCGQHDFICPKSSALLEKKSGYWWSSDGGWAYPEIEGVPCLRERHAILMSHA